MLMMYSNTVWGKKKKKCVCRLYFFYIYIYINSDILADTFINVYALKKMTFINGKLHWKKKKKKAWCQNIMGSKVLRSV